MKLTKTTVDRVPVSTDKDLVLVRDAVLQGFALRITQKGVKSFLLDTRIKVRNIGKTPGQYPALINEQARIDDRLVDRIRPEDGRVIPSCQFTLAPEPLAGTGCFHASRKILAESVSSSRQTGNPQVCSRTLLETHSSP